MSLLFPPTPLLAALLLLGTRGFFLPPLSPLSSSVCAMSSPVSRTRIYVGKVSNRSREGDLRDLFGKYGPIRHVDVKYGFAFVVCALPARCPLATDTRQHDRVSGASLPLSGCTCSSPPACASAIL